MSSVLHRTTRQYLSSVNTPDYPVIDWIINPDLSAITGFANQYWIITGDVITLMDQSARDAVDVTNLSDARDRIANELDKTQDATIEFFKLTIDELNNKADKINAILAAAAAATNLGSFKSEMALINNEPARTMAQLKTALRAALDT